MLIRKINYLDKNIDIIYFTVDKIDFFEYNFIGNQALCIDFLETPLNLFDLF